MNRPDPFSKLSDELAENYPPTKEELRGLAVHWMKAHIHNQAWCVLLSTSGGAEVQVAGYTADRVNLIADILGANEMESVFSEADEWLRKQLGDEFFTAHEEGRPLGMEILETEWAREQEQELAKRKTPQEQIRSTVMSRHTFTGKEPNLRIVVGWDRPLQTYFAQVWDGGELEKGFLLLWEGAGPEPVPTVDALAELLAPFGTIPDDIASQLRDEFQETWEGFTLEKLLSGR